MSSPIANQHEEEKDEFLQQDDAQEIVGDDHDNEEPLSGDDMDEGDTLEIDMRNNSTTYFDKHTDSVYLIASHPTLPLAVSGGGDNKAYLWTTTHSPPKLAAEFNEPTESVIAGGFTANGKYLVLGDMSGRLLVYKSNATREKWTLMSNSQEVDEIVHISFHPEFSIFAVSASDGSIWCYEISDDIEMLAVLNGHELPTAATVFISGGSDLQVLSASEDGHLILWDVYKAQAVYNLGPSKLGGEHPWVNLALSPTGKTAAAGSMDGFVVLIKLADGALLRTVDTTTVKPETPAEPKAESSSEEGEEEASGDSIEGLAWSDKTMLLATGNVDGTIVLWDTQTWRPRCTFQLQDSVTKMEFVKGTQFLVVSGIDGSLGMYDVINNEQTWECLGHNEGVLGFAIQENGRRLISASDDHICLVFNQE